MLLNILLRMLAFRKGFILFNGSNYDTLIETRAGGRWEHGDPQAGFASGVKQGQPIETRALVWLSSSPAHG